MRPTDIESLIGVGRPAISSDGAFAVFASFRPDLAADRTVGQLWRVDLAEGTPRRLTRGVHDRSPRLSPDDAVVAFLREDARGRAQIFVVDAGGGEPVQVTDQPGGVTDLAFSPEGGRLAFSARVPEPGRYGTVEGRDAAAEPPRRITGIRWHANGLGYLDRPAQLFVVDVPATDAEPFYPPAPALDEPRARVVAGSATQLTHGDADWGGVVWTADGAELLSVPDEIESRRRDLRDRVVAIAVDGGVQREVLGTAENLSIASVGVAPDGTVFVLANDVGEGGVDFVAPGVALFAVGADGPRALTDAETIDLGEVGSHLTFDGDDVLVQDRARGRVRLLRVTRTGAVSEVLGGDLEVNGHAAAAGRVVASVASPESFGELVMLHGREMRALTSFGAAARERGVVVPVEREVTGRDGYPVHGWVAVPEGEGPFPVVLQIHGGPYAAYGVHLFDETRCSWMPGTRCCTPTRGGAPGTVAPTVGRSGDAWAPSTSPTSWTSSTPSSRTTPGSTATAPVSWAARTAATSRRGSSPTITASPGRSSNAVSSTPRPSPVRATSARSSVRSTSAPTPRGSPRRARWRWSTGCAPRRSCCTPSAICAARSTRRRATTPR